MKCQQIDINKIKVNEKSLLVIPDKKQIKKIERQFLYDKDNIYIIVDKKYNLLYNLNHYKFAIMYDFQQINCVVLEKDEYFDGADKTIKLNKKGAERMANLLAKKIKESKPTDLEKIAMKNNCICYICGNKTTIRKKSHSNYFDSATQDHVKPRAKGGSNSKSNIKCCCRYCNNMKADRVLTPDLKELIIEQRMLLEKYNITTFKMLNQNKEIKKSLSMQLIYYDKWYNNKDL